MCRTGGPRCKGSGGRNTRTTTGGGGAPVATAERDTQPRTPPAEAFESLRRAAQDTSARAHGAPTRDDTDRLAAAYDPNAKGWDGQPLDDKGRRLFALRESGWKGPIDQDGYPDTTSAGADTLRYMARQRGESVDW